MDVGDGEPVASNPLIAEQRVEPAHSIASALLHPASRFRDAPHPRFEHLQPFGKIEAHHHWLADIQFDPAPPHPGGRPLHGRAADQR